jgi:hypothetical protein
MEFEKKISDDLFKKYRGKYFGESWYTHIIDKNQNGYYHENGVKKTLFKFRKNKINEKLSSLAITTFLEMSKKKHPNRGNAGGLDKTGNARHFTKTGQSESNYTSSNISGYYDRPLREHRGILKTNVGCRTTSFTLNNKELWEKGLPFIEKCSSLYKHLSPRHYLLQKCEYDKINKSLKIKNTVFTTITSNYNWRTACHQDCGDFSGGLGNLVVLGDGFTGGYLGFPQFKVLIKIEPGDFLLMDVHQWHCNTQIKGTNPTRLSFVMYIREDMKLCKKEKIIKNNKYLI